jgi:hypothetical protein
MAWFVCMDSRNRGDEDETYLSPETEVIPEEQERYQAIGKAFAQKLIDDYRAAGKNPYEVALLGSTPDHPYFSPYVLAPMREGWRWPMLDRPLRDKLKSKEGMLVDIIDSSFNTYAVSQRVIDIIESIEPNVHQYLPYELIQKDGSVHPDKRWLLNVCSRIAALDYEQSNLFSYRESPYLYDDNTGEHFLVARKGIVASRALWFEYRYLGTHGQFLLSDRLWDALNRAGCAGWRPKNGFRGQHIEEL